MWGRLQSLVHENALFFAGFLFFIACSGFLLLFFGKNELFLLQNALHHPTADALTPWLTHLGDGLFAFAVFLILLLLNYRSALTALFCFTVVLLLIQAGKQLVFDDALRPAAYFAALGQEIRLIEGVKIHARNSFPSGHSASAFVLFTFLAMHFQNKRWGPFLLIAAVLIAYTRIYLAQHFMGDVLAGACIGAGVALFGKAWLDGVFERSPKAWHQRGLLRK